MLASILEKDCNQALTMIKNIDTKNNKALMYEVADIKTWSYLGLHFSEKIKGGIALQRYRMNGDEKIGNLPSCIWKKRFHIGTKLLITRPLYNDMPLVHLSQQGGKESRENFYLTFHWEKLRADVANDIEIARKVRH